MLDVIDSNQAIELSKNEKELNSIEVPLCEALGYTLSRDIISKENVPSFHRSLVDGYCVKSKDVFGSSLSIPAMLEYQGKIEMGETPREELKDGCCIYVPTGGELAPGSDTVVMIEHVEDMDDGFRYINKPSAPGDHITFLGDDVKVNEIVLNKGTRISSKIIGVLSSLGYDKVPVYEKLRVGLLATGDEVIPTGEQITGAKVRDINNPLLESLLIEYDCIVDVYGIVKDDEKDIKEALVKLSQENDVVIVSGGSSVGEKDKTLEILESFKGARTLFHGLALKPGKPTMFVRLESCDVFGLPGHPLACYFVAQTLLKPYIDGRYRREYKEETIKAISKVSIGSNHGREECMIVTTEEIDGDLYFEPLPSKSGMISRLAQGDAFIRIPRDKEGIDESEVVEIIRI